MAVYGYKPGPKGGSRVFASRNLRGVLDYARKVGGVDVVAIKRRPFDSAQVDFEFHDGAYAQALFNSFTVAKAWVFARRSWGMELVTETPEKAVFVTPGCKIKEEN